jgi:hypothetical protein
MGQPSAIRGTTFARVTCSRRSTSALIRRSFRRVHLYNRWTRRVQSGLSGQDPGVVLDTVQRLLRPDEMGVGSDEARQRRPQLPEWTVSSKVASADAAESPGGSRLVSRLVSSAPPGRSDNTCLQRLTVSMAEYEDRQASCTRGPCRRLGQLRFRIWIVSRLRREVVSRHRHADR